MACAFKRILVACSLLLVAIAQEVVIENAFREIALLSQATGITQRLTMRNTGRKPVESVEVCYPASHDGHEALFEVVQGKEATEPLQLEESSAGERHGALCVMAALQTPLQPGKTTDIQVGASLTQLQMPFPEAIFQSEPQRVLYYDSLYILSPYKVLQQTTKVKLPSKAVESYTKLQPFSLAAAVLTYGPYENIEPFSNLELRLHFENNTPFSVATRLVREVEISHWGNIYIEENYIIKHTGAKIRGEWSRLDLMRDPQTFGQAAIRAFLANLPAGANSIYFKDAIGNISTSQVKRGLQTTEVIITPRYPLYGGWQAEFTLGYSLPLSDAVFRVPRSGILRATALLGTPLMGVLVEDLEIRMVLPEGSTVVNVETPYRVEMSREKKYTYLDTSGRPVVVLRKNNVAFEHNQPFLVDYTFSSLSLLREPLLLVAFYTLMFAIVIIYGRCDFVITRDATWEAAQRAERTAFLVQDITAIVTEREREVSDASSGSSQDVSALLARLKRSEGELKGRCSELEQYAGPKHSAKVREILDKERAVQARISQIAAVKGQLLQQGSSKQEVDAKVAENLQGLSGLQKDATAKLEALS